MHLSNMRMAHDDAEPGKRKEAEWIWNLKSQYWVKFFVWKLVWERL